ncbi:hypothetical protein BWR18_10110 [Tateyamaria omphalii]|uniref:Uncharacterized protein n=1 Tax=Tateyamaria omphalii TaxID=299262 RepID=A0A1P8MVH0_9RHOB|nr:hypothetical protein BWR18_10110 [Tateyamaria omphalii]
MTVIIGDFRRRAFAEGLVARLSEQKGFAVRAVDSDKVAQTLAEVSGPKVVIVDAADNRVYFDQCTDKDALATIRIVDEGARADVQLLHLETAQIIRIAEIAFGTESRVAPIVLGEAVSRWLEVWGALPGQSRALTMAGVGVP